VSTTDRRRDQGRVAAGAAAPRTRMARLAQVEHDAVDICPSRVERLGRGLRQASRCSTIVPEQSVDASAARRRSSDDDQEPLAARRRRTPAVRVRVPRSASVGSVLVREAERPAREAVPVSSSGSRRTGMWRGHGIALELAEHRPASMSGR
jgi:hypothetical protein